MFWSHPQQREALRETYGPGFGVGALGVQQGSNASTPRNQKDLRNPQNQRSQVDMDPVELFRLRCLREAEKKSDKVC